MHSVLLHEAGQVFAMKFCLHWPASAHASQRWSLSTQAGFASDGGLDALAGVARDATGWPAAGLATGGLAAGGWRLTGAAGGAFMVAANGDNAGRGGAPFAHRPQLSMHSFFIKLRLRWHSPFFTHSSHLMSSS